MKIDYKQIYRALSLDLGVDRYSASYVDRRLHNEGTYVITTLLPSFSKHVLMCLELGHWVDFSTSMRVRRGLPLFLRGYLKALFHLDQSNKWVVRSDCDPVSLWAIRQYCEYCYKLSLPYDKSLLENKEEKFIEVDDSVLTYGDYDNVFVDAMRKNFETYYPSASRITLQSIAVSAHPGPGTFSGSKRGWYRRNYLPAVVPPEASDLRNGLRLTRRAPNPKVVLGEPRFSEVLFVPKDSRGPRVIMREPYDLLQFQMGFNTQMTSALERDTCNRINFVSQDINKELARTSSIDKQFATLDLEDGSDRVSFAIVQHLFRYLPLAKALRFRVKDAKLPSGSYKPLRKLSGMGSGFTFPTMALVIHLAICTHVSKRLGISYQRAMKCVYVYGDDIIVPTTWYEMAVHALTKVGLSINSSKSYWKSHFRESCGGDYLYGNDVSPCRLKLSNAKLRDSNILAADDLDALIFGLERHCRELLSKQLFNTSELYYQFIESYLGKLPFVSGSSPILGRHTSPDDVYRDLRVSEETGRYVRKPYWVSVPDKDTVKCACPYRYLYTLVAKVGSDMFKSLFENGRHTKFGEISIPRTLKLKRRKMSSLLTVGI